MRKRSTHYFRMLVCIALICTGVNRVNAQTLLQKIEAEDGEIVNIKTTSSNWIKITETSEENGNIGLLSNEKYIENVHPLGYCKYVVNVEKEGTYELRIHYMDAFSDKTPRRVGVGVNSQIVFTYDTPKKTFGWTGVAGADSTDRENLIEYNGVEVMSVLIYLEQGNNVLKIGGWRVDTTPWGPNMDYFELYTTDQVIQKPEDYSCIWHWSYASEAIITAEHNNETVKNLADLNQKTFYTVAGVKKSYLEFEFPYDFTASGFLVFAGAGKSFNSDYVNLQRSTDNRATWTSVGKNVSDPRNEGQVFSLSSTAKTKYYRIEIETEESDLNIAEVQLFGWPEVGATQVYPVNLMDITTQGSSGNKVAIGNNGTFTYSNNGLTNFGEVAANAVDRVRNKFTSSGKTFWLQYEFNDYKTAKSYSVGIGADSNMDRNPKSWRLVASPDWGGTWDTLAVVTDFVFPKCTYSNLKFKIENPGEYISYKFEVTANRGNEYCHISEWQLFADTIPESAPGDQSSIDWVNVSQVFDNVLVYPGEQSVTIENKTRVSGSYQFYTVAGMIVQSGVVEDSATIHIRPGIYILKLSVDNRVKAIKVLVK